MRQTSSSTFLLTLTLLLSPLLAAEPSLRLIPSPEPDWPQWRGPRRDGLSAEKNLLPSWPDAGPPLLWRTPNLGQGWSSPILVRDTLYLTGDIDNQLHLFALDLAGRLKWTARNGPAWDRAYPGARACPAYSAGRIYHMNAHGRVACFDAATGRELWAVNVIERFASRVITWGLAENLLIDGDRVIVTPGGRKGAMAALDKRTGATLWTTGPVPDLVNDPDALGPAYGSPILFEFNGRRLIAGFTTRHLLCADAGTGQLVFTHPLRTRYEVIGLTPALLPSGLFITAPDSDAGRLLRLIPQGNRIDVQTAWTTDLDTCHGGALLVDHRLYASWYRRYNGWGCIDPATGQTLHRTRELPMGSAIHADGRLYCLAQDGTMALVDPSPDAFRILSRFRLTPSRVSDAWAHPVILSRRLYLRYHDTLFCYDIAKKPS